MGRQFADCEERTATQNALAASRYDLRFISVPPCLEYKMGTTAEAASCEKIFLCTVVDQGSVGNLLESSGDGHRALQQVRPASVLISRALTGL